jgi:hypothetical protein
MLDSFPTLKSSLPFLFLSVLVLLALLVQKKFSSTAAIQSWQIEAHKLTPEESIGYEALRNMTSLAKRNYQNSGQFSVVNPFATTQLSRTINISGVIHQTRWLTVVLLPEKNEKESVPEDDEHHNLSDGTSIHVTYWKKAANEPVGTSVIAYPAAEGFNQIVR